MKNSNAAGGIACLVYTLILGLVIYLMVRFGWIFFIALPLIGFVRGWIWRYRVKKALSKNNTEQTNSKDSYIGNDKYCEAEFEIVEDETE